MKLSRRRCLLAGVAIAGLALVIVAGLDWFATDAPRGPYLQQSSPDGVVIRWRSRQVAKTEVRYGPAPDRLVHVKRADIRGLDHSVSLSGLTPGTEYFYALSPFPSLSWRPARTYRFVTPPPIGSAAPTRVWVLGDSGTGLPAQMAVRDAFYRFGEHHPADVWLMLGDNAYRNGTEAEYQEHLFAVYPDLLERTALWPALGNHDAYSADSPTQTGAYFDLFSLPTQGQCGGVMSGTEAYYAFNHANVHFVCLDSEGSDRSPAGPMLSWLKDDLRENHQTWTVAYWHHPPYTKGLHDSDPGVEMREMRENALPILEAAGVDLVLAGHSHNYERSLLLDGHYGTSDTFSELFLKNRGDGRFEGSGPYEKPAAPHTPHAGTVYVVAGSSGHASRLQAMPHPAMCVSLNVAGSLVLDVAALRLEATFLDAAGQVRDRFAIVKGDKSPPDGTFSSARNP